MGVEMVTLFSLHVASLKPARSMLLIAVMAVSTSNAPAASQANESFPPVLVIKDLFGANSSDLLITPDFTDADAIEEFKDLTPLHGFVSIGERMVLVTRNKRDAQKFLVDRSTGKALFDGESPSPFRIKELPGFTAFEITKAKYLTPLARQLNGLHAWDEGPNCWNLCMMSKGWTQTAYSVNGSEFNLLADGPFATFSKGSNPFMLEPKHGDLIILRSRNFVTGAMREDHCAVALGNGLVFTKNGEGYEAPYQVVELSEMLKTYLPAISNSIEIKTLRSFDEVWSEWKGKISPELSSMVERWMAFEARHAKAFVLKRGQPKMEEAKFQEESKALDQIRFALNKEFTPIIKARLGSYIGRELNEKEKVEQFFWHLLEERNKISYF
jgi:hypothetical protein